MIQNGVLFSDLQTKQKKVKIAHNHLDYFKASQLQQSCLLTVSLEKPLFEE